MHSQQQLAFLSAFRSRSDLPTAARFDGYRFDDLVDDARELELIYRSWSPPQSTSAAAARPLEVFAPRSFDLVHSYDSWRMAGQGDVMRREWDVERWKRQVLHLCLYTDSLWLPDPIELIASGIADAERERGSIAIHETLIAAPLAASEMATALTADLAPLVESGVVRLYPAITQYKQRISEQLFGEVRNYTLRELRNKWPDGYVVEGLFYADAFNASYVALDSAEFGALQKAMHDVARIVGVADQRILATLPRMQLPYFDGLNAKSLVSVRASDASFDDFRSLLGETSRQLVAGVDDPQFDAEVARLEKDILTPAFNKLVSDVTGTTALRERLADVKVDFMAGALSGFLLKGDLEAAVVGGAVTTLAKALMKTVFTSKSARPAARAVYQFHTGKPFGFMTVR